MTQTQCKDKFEERVNDNISYNNLDVGQVAIDIDEKEVSGYEETIIKNIPVSAKLWGKNVSYKFGSIVSYGNEIYVSRRDFNKGNTVFDSFYWLKKELKAANIGTGYNISNYCFIKDNVQLSAFETILEAGNVNYDFKFTFDTASANPYTIPIVQPLDVRDIGAPTTGLLDWGFYPQNAYMGEILNTAGTFDLTKMSLFSAFIKV